MKKKNFILIGLSILLLLISIMMPFIGFNKNGIVLTNFPLNLLGSFILMFLGLKGLYKDTNNHDFYIGSVMCIVGIVVSIVGTLVSPLIIKNYTNIYKFYEILYKMQDSEDVSLFFFYFGKLFESFGIFFVVYIISFYFYGFAAFRFISGIKRQNIVVEHKVKLNKVVKTFIITNMILFIISAITMYFFKDFFMDFAPYVNSSELPDAVAAKLGLKFEGLYLGILPCLIVASIFYYINVIKSLIFVFKTPNNFVKEEFEEVIDVNI